MTTKLETLREKQKQLAARIRDLEARERQQERKRDTRRKIIAGALALQHMEKNKSTEFGRKMATLLDEYVTKPEERALFGLDPLEGNDNRTEDQNSTAGRYNTAARKI